jgi:hypothetical protein
MWQGHYSKQGRTKVIVVLAKYGIIIVPLGAEHVHRALSLGGLHTISHCI